METPRAFVILPIITTEGVLIKPLSILAEMEGISQAVPLLPKPLGFGNPQRETAVSRPLPVRISLL